MPKEEEEDKSDSGMATPARSAGIDVVSINFEFRSLHLDSRSVRARCPSSGLAYMIFSMIKDCVMPTHAWLHLLDRDIGLYHDGGTQNAATADSTCARH